MVMGTRAREINIFLKEIEIEKMVIDFDVKNEIKLTFLVLLLHKLQYILNFT